MSRWATGGSIWFRRRHLGAPKKRGHSPWGPPLPQLLLPHTGTSQHLHGCSGHLGGPGWQGLTKDEGRGGEEWSLSSRCSQLQRTEADTKQVPPQSAPCSPFPLLSSHKLHTGALGLEPAVQPPALALSVDTRCPFSPRPPGERVQQSHLLSARATWAPLTQCCVAGSSHSLPEQIAGISS